jgi:hypothetical protein
VTFTPSTYGTRSGTLNIPSSDPDTPTLSIILNGAGEASNIGVSPASPVDFGSVNVGSSSSAHTFTVGNTGNINLVMERIVSDNTEFSINNDNCSGQAIAPAEACTFQITFTPSTYGVSNATLSILSNDYDTPTFSIVLNGLGQASNIGVVPTTPIEFGFVNVGSSSAPVTFTVTNTGNIPLVIGTIRSSNAEFIVSNDTCSRRVTPPGKSCKLDVVFAPSTDGTRTGILSIPSNDPDSGYVTAALSGTGVDDTTVYTFTGFFPPVDNPPVVNVAKAGQKIPVRWRIADSNGVPISDPASFVSLTSSAVSCTNFTMYPTDPVTEITSGNTTLRYMGDGNWEYNWKTPKTYSNPAEQCREMVLTLKDGSEYRANFRFTK